MRALTLHAPWAWAVAHAAKRVENRTWLGPVGETILIHAGATDTRDARDCMRARGVYVPDAIPRSAVVASARVVRMIHASDSAWFIGPIGWSLDEVRVLASPVPCRGALGLWRPPPAVLRAVHRQLSHVAT